MCIRHLILLTLIIVVALIGLTTASGEEEVEIALPIRVEKVSPREKLAFKEEKILLEFLLKNECEAPIALLAFNATCNCTQVEADLRSIPPGGQASVRGAIHPPFRAGLNKITVFVRTDHPDQEIIALETEFFFGYSVTNIPPTLVFDNLRPGDRRTRDLEFIFQKEDAPLILKSLTTESRHLSIPDLIPPKVDHGLRDVITVPVTAEFFQEDTFLTATIVDEKENHFVKTIPVILTKKKMFHLRPGAVTLSPGRSRQTVEIHLTPEFSDHFADRPMKSPPGLAVKILPRRNGNVVPVEIGLVPGERTGVRAHGAKTVVIDAGDVIGPISVPVFWRGLGGE